MIDTLCLSVYISLLLFVVVVVTLVNTPVKQKVVSVGCEILQKQNPGNPLCVWGLLEVWAMHAMVSSR